jgi:UDP-glucose 4-epimerase
VTPDPNEGVRPFQSALVLGGAGFLGGWIVRGLRDRGIRVTVVDDLSTGFRERRDDVELIEADVMSIGLARLLAARAIDVVFHLASASYVPPSFQHPIDDLLHNAATTLAVLEAARSVGRPPLVVLASSAAVYGEARRMPITEQHPIAPLSPYGVSKFAAEQYGRLYAQRYGLPFFAVRLFSLYGPGQRKQVVYDLMTRTLDGEDPLRILGWPEVTRDLVFVRDAAEAFLTLAARARGLGEAFNIASGRPTSLMRLATLILETLERRATLDFTGAVRPGDPVHWTGDPSKARGLGVECPTSLLQGIRETADWLVASRPAASVGAAL